MARRALAAAEPARKPPRLHPEPQNHRARNVQRGCMTKVANAFYSTAVSHKEIDGLYHATFGIPGEPAMWVNDTDGKPKVFRSHDEAVIAGFKVMVSKLNRAR